MDLKNELKESVAECKNAKATQNAWVSNARNEANKHNSRKNFWIVIIIVLSLTIGGLYTEYLSWITEYVSSIYGWIGLESYTLYISAALIILGAVRIWKHIKKRNEQTLYANQIESMQLTKFRHTYM